MQKKKIHRIIVGDIATNCWICPLLTNDAPEQAGGQGQPCAVIDPGAEGGRITAFMDQLKLFPQYIVLSHGHFDHIGAVPALIGECRKRNDKAPETAIHAADAEYLGPDSYPVHCRSFSAVAGNTDYIDALWEDMPPPDRALKEGDAIGPFTVLHLPGHTPGSIGLWDREAGILFSGDTLFRGNYGRTDLPGGSQPLLIDSLRRLYALDGGIQVYPGHGPVTTIENER
ncbi:MAG: MBL fold metallo-hydrolase [Treponema sp.]|jgi:glyoxylase-like metal-dependent hydrolase (beta-lactamase superfamily II)|nr:MBL fold metallo-hydrolase [Treponema sp.]